MSEVIRALQWNIGGGKVRHPDADPTLFPYDQEGLEEIIDTIEESNADIVTLQETHENGSSSQTAEIAEAAGYPYWVNDHYGESHIDPDYHLGQAVISRYPLDNHTFQTFINPGYTAEWATRSHDKGVTSVHLALGNKAVLQAQTLHAVPFRAFGVDPYSELAKPVLEDMEARVLATSIGDGILQGDFNLDYPSLLEFFPQLLRSGRFEEVLQALGTTPKGGKIDHILYSGVVLVRSEVVSKVLTDHYPIVTDFARK